MNTADILLTHCTADLGVAAFDVSNSRHWLNTRSNATEQHAAPQPLDEYSIRIYTSQLITWNAFKRRANLRKHGFDFVDAWEVFDAVTYTYEDDRLAYGAQRLMTLGLLRGVAVSIVHTEEGDHIHIISMRKATRHEREVYFKRIAN